MSSHGLDGFTETVICGLYGGETDQSAGQGDEPNLRCLSCENEMSFQEAREALGEFVKDEHVRQLQRQTSAISDRFSWINVQNHTIPEREYRFLLKPTEGGERSGWPTHAASPVWVAQ